MQVQHATGLVPLCTCTKVPAAPALTAGQSHAAPNMQLHCNAVLGTQCPAAVLGSTAAQQQNRPVTAAQLCCAESTAQDLSRRWPFHLVRLTCTPPHAAKTCPVPPHPCSQDIPRTLAFYACGNGILEGYAWANQLCGWAKNPAQNLGYGGLPGRLQLALSPATPQLTVHILHPPTSHSPSPARPHPWSLQPCAGPWAATASCPGTSGPTTPARGTTPETSTGMRSASRTRQVGRAHVV